MTGRICLFSFGHIWEGNRTSLEAVAGRTDLTGSDRQQKHDSIKISFPSAHPPGHCSEPSWRVPKVVRGR